MTIGVAFISIKILKMKFFVRIIFSSVILFALNEKSCRSDDESFGSLTIECSDIEIFYSEQGTVRYKIEAISIVRDKDESMRLPNGGTLTAYKDDGAIDFIAHASTAYNTSDNRLWTLEGDVYVESRGARLETQSLTWDRDSKLISTKDEVRILRRQDILIGQGLNAKQDLSYYKINSPQGSLEAEAFSKKD